MKLRLLFLAALCVAGLAMPVRAQSLLPTVVSSCGSSSFTAGKQYHFTMDTTGKLCDSGGSGGGAVTANQGTAAAASGAWPNYVVPQSAAGGFGAPYRLQTSLATTNAAVIATGAHRHFKIRAYNSGSTVVYVKFYNTATTPVPGTTAVVDYFPLQATSVSSFDYNVIGESFSAGIGIAITANPADTDTTAITAGEVTGLAVVYQ